ncbi:helix-turn-helix domain-containing protein [Chryseobacterium sp. MYb264]|uniref:helix-turn-helix domain-containing protein n=1 Tax=Chryseobacterium sp. MYb264 TaxID=2745153 RepID=UPI002E0F81C1|nr:helix-turn-helix domain-containing protein [Chryseobacterium sp. MYb264]
MSKKILLLIILFSTMIWAQKDNNTFDNLYRKTLTETASKDIPRALKIADSLINAAKTPEIKGKSLMLASQIYLQKVQYEKSINYAEQAKDILNTTENYELQAKIRGLLSNVYRQMSLNHKSTNYLNEGLKIADKIKNQQKRDHTKALFFQELAEIEANAERYKASVENVQKSLKYLSQIPADSIAIGRDHQMLGQLYGDYLNNIELSEAHYLKAIQFLPESNMNTGLCYDGLGKIKLLQKDYKEAEKFFSKALQYAEASDIPEMKRHMYSSMAELYESTNQYKKASFYRKKQTENINKIQDKSLEFIDNDYNKIEKEKEKYASISNKQNIILGIAVLIILALITMYIINRKKRKEKYRRFKNIINHYKEKSEYVLEIKVDTSDVDEKSNEEEIISSEIDSEHMQADIAINKETELKILEQLERFEKEETFNNNYISLSYLATEFNTNIRYISYVVKKHKNADFKNYINKLRINYIIHKLNTSEKYRKYKVGALAEECGFSSHSKFTTIFKSITGISPSNFISFIEEEEAKKRAIA